MSYKIESMYLISVTVIGFLCTFSITALLYFGMLTVTLSKIILFIFGFTYTIPYYLPAAIYATKFGGPSFCAVISGFVNSCFLIF